MNWKVEPLRALGTWYGGGTPSKGRTDFWDGGDVPWLSPKDMSADVLAGTRDHITRAAVEQSAARLVPPMSVALVVRSGILERKIPVALVPFATTLNQDMKAVSCRPDVDPRWVSWGLRASEQALLRGARKAGTTVASLEWPRVLNWRLPVPPLDEQRRIVDILEDHLSHLDAANDYLDAAERHTRSFVQSVLDRLVWIPDVRTVPLASVLREPMRNGFSARASATGSVRILTLTAVTRRTFTDEHTKMTDAEPERVRGLWLEPGDVFVQRANTPELVGSAALYDGEPGWAVFPDLLIRVRPDPTVMTPRFLALALQTERCHRALRARAKGLAGSMPKVDQGAIAAQELPCPSLDDQHRIVAEADSCLASVRTLSDAASTAHRRSLTLRRGVLAAAFSGRLSGRPAGSERVEELTFS